MSTVQLRDGSALATNGKVIMEYWHGIKMPSLTLIPKTFITALGKAKKPIARFGVCDSSFTLWFDEATWLKCQTYPTTTELPNLIQYLDVPTQPVPVPKGFFEIVKRLEPFTSDDTVQFSDDAVKVTFATEASYKGFPTNISFSVKALLGIANYAKQIHFNALPGTTVFYGDNLRGAITNK
jgi:hypothetical protein